MLKSVNSEWYYVGSTGDVGKRLKHHNYGDVISTRPRRPYKVVYIEKFSTIECARSREKQIKQSRSIKDGIIKKLALSSNG